MNKLRIAVVIKHAGFLHYIQTQIEVLCEHGHSVHLAIQDSPILDEDGLLGVLSAKYPSISVGYAVSRQDPWARLAGDLRGALDRFHYMHPDYADGPRQRRHVGSGQLAGAVDRTSGSINSAFSAVLSNVRISLLRSIHSSLPPDPDILSYLTQLDLDLVLVTGLVSPHSGQADYVLASKALGIPTAYIVNSWDDLSNKGDIKIVPDAVYVWNEEQRREAERHHGAPRGDVFVTGAPPFDRWFDRSPTESRRSFCERVGLPDDGPFVLYACSSPSIAPNRSETGYFRNWLLNLRNAPAESVRQVNVLLRPHPFNPAAWSDFDPLDARVALHPRHGRRIVREEDRSDYFHALRYCSVVVGLNTSTMIEAAILGAPTLSVRSDKFSSMQEGTPHFHYLRKLRIVQLHTKMDEHLLALADLVATVPAKDRRSIPGVLPFVRPQGSAASATEIAVAAIEQQASQGGKPRRMFLPIWRPLMVVALEVVTVARLIGLGRPRREAFTSTQVTERTPPTAAQRFFGRHVLGRVLLWSLKRLGSPGLRAIISEQLSDSELERIDEVESALAEACKGDRPILVGPWLSEVGFEILYWIPFLRWFRKHLKIPPERLVIISRGGTKCWYEGILGEYVDVFDFYSLDEFRRRNLSHSIEFGHQKQTRVSTMDHEIYEIVARTLNISEYNTLHPWVMYHLFLRYWEGIGGHQFIDRYTRFAPLRIRPKLVAKACKTLPDRFVAVKFYFRDSFPNTPENRKFVSDIIGIISEHIDVVLLASDVRIDDHTDYNIRSSGRIHHVDHMVRASENLHLQTAIIAGAEAFIGTYGGLTYVANCLGKTSISFETEPQHNLIRHTELAMRQLRQFGGNSHILQPKDLEYFKWLLATV